MLRNSIPSAGFELSLGGPEVVVWQLHLKRHRLWV